MRTDIREISTSAALTIDTGEAFTEGIGQGSRGHQVLDGGNDELLKVLHGHGGDVPQLLEKLVCPGRLHVLVLQRLQDLPELIQHLARVQETAPSQLQSGTVWSLGHYHDGDRFPSPNMQFVNIFKCNQSVINVSNLGNSHSIKCETACKDKFHC